jgi:hypothetical protein
MKFIATLILIFCCSSAMSESFTENSSKEWRGDLTTGGRRLAGIFKVIEVTHPFATCDEYTEFGGLLHSRTMPAPGCVIEFEIGKIDKSDKFIKTGDSMKVFVNKK